MLLIIQVLKVLDMSREEFYVPCSPYPFPVSGISHSFFCHTSKQANMNHNFLLFEGYSGFLKFRCHSYLSDHSDKVKVFSNYSLHKNELLLLKGD